MWGIYYQSLVCQQQYPFQHSRTYPCSHRTWVLDNPSSLPSSFFFFLTLPRSIFPVVLFLILGCNSYDVRPFKRQVPSLPPSLPFFPSPPSFLTSFYPYFPSPPLLTPLSPISLTSSPLDLWWMAVPSNGPLVLLHPLEAGKRPNPHHPHSLWCWERKWRRRTQELQESKYLRR